MNVSIYKNLKQISTKPSIVKANDVLYGILQGRWKDAIEEIRKSDDKSQLKKNLPVVVFSGEMTNPVPKEDKGKKYNSYRDDKSLAVHSGLCVVDLDHVEKLEETKSKLCSVKEVYSVFVSPSGDGLKVIYRIPANVKKHRGYYRAILDDLKKLGIKTDTTSINESRLCFVSYDEDLYLNEYADMFTDYVEDAEAIIEDIVPVIKENTLTDFNKLAIGAKMIDSAQDGYKHHTLIKASYLMGGYIASGKVSEKDAIAMLKDRIKRKDIKDERQAFKTIEDGVRKGKNKPIYEIEELENEFKTHLSKEEFKDEQRTFTFLVDNSDVDSRMMAYIKDGEKEGFSTGSHELDTHFVFKENTFNVILGHDNVGKSFATWFLAVCASCHHGWRWIIYSPENKIHRIKKQMIDFVLGTESNGVSDDKFNKAKQLVDEHFIFIRKDMEYNIFQLLEYGEILCRTDKKIKGFLIDPYNSLSLDYKNRGRGLSAYEYHLKAATNMRIFSEKFCTIYLNGHSVTGARRKMLDADGVLIRPRKDDMEQGGLWANRADDFLVIHRKVKSEDEWMYTEIHVDKVKDVETGGRVTFEEPVKFKLKYGCDFVDSTGDSPLKEWRNEFFNGTQTKLLELPKIDVQDAF